MHVSVLSHQVMVCVCFNIPHVVATYMCVCLYMYVSIPKLTVATHIRQLLTINNRVNFAKNSLVISYNFVNTYPTNSLTKKLPTQQTQCIAF